MSLTALIPLAGTLIERIFPDKEARDKAKLELLAMDRARQRVAEPGLRFAGGG